jgi:hypothetical protein
VRTPTGYDVVVVGAGLAGLQCARLLAGEGLSVLLADARPSLDRSIHTTGIFVRKTLEDFAFPPSCLGAPVREVVLLLSGAARTPLVSRHDEFRIGRMGALYAHLLEECRAAGVDWSPADALHGVGGDDGGSLLRFEREGTPWWVRCRFVVGADGARSLVAQDLGLDVNREWIVGVEEVLSPVCPQPGTSAPARLSSIRSARPATSRGSPTTARKFHVGVGGYPSRFDPLSALRSFRDSLGDFIDCRGRASSSGAADGIPVGGVLARIASTRWTPRRAMPRARPRRSPPGGLDPCMRLSALAARVVSSVPEIRRSRACSRCTRGRAFAPGSSRAVSCAGRSRATASARVLETGCALLRSPVLRPFARHVFFGRGSFPDIIPLPNPRPPVAAARLGR